MNTINLIRTTWYCEKRFKSWLKWDETHFLIGDYVNQENCQLLGFGEMNPLLPEKVLILWPGVVLHYENDTGRIV